MTAYHTWGQVRHPFPDGDYLMASSQGRAEIQGNASGWTFAIEDAPRSPTPTPLGMSMKSRCTAMAASPAM
ncbi:MAG: hypothetical protein C7B46_04785 [Sulfobacillus benefaciens]|uniref:Uncharacterized protein n=1 Tax=Sulfobacillus benefaciens TaxID=453960 RepID=A0A2T2XJ35_9FIRM|nr:MAG: hypothetical protein C7B46_04785 [Sulfobacillus benefaciens]